jgi:hypothetical protein
VHFQLNSSADGTLSDADVECTHAHVHTLRQTCINYKRADWVHPVCMHKRDTNGCACVHIVRMTCTHLADLEHEFVLIQTHIAIVGCAVNALNDARWPILNGRRERVLPQQCTCACTRALTCPMTVVPRVNVCLRRLLVGVSSIDATRCANAVGCRLHAHTWAHMCAYTRTGFRSLAIHQRTTTPS